MSPKSKPKVPHFGKALIPMHILHTHINRNTREITVLVVNNLEENFTQTVDSSNMGQGHMLSKVNIRPYLTVNSHLISCGWACSSFELGMTCIGFKTVSAFRISYSER